MNSLIGAEAHFAFGENWKSFTHLLDDKRIEEAENGLRRLFPNDELRGARFLDIGCGSGLSALAALRLGAASVDAVDIDPASVAATQATLTRYAPNSRWSAKVVSVFDLSPEPGYDIVYSWGVLHHTGDVWRAVETAARAVRPGGLFAIALYRKTEWCGFWTREKKFYANAPSIVQAFIRGGYKSMKILRLLRGRINPVTHIRSYHSSRGMSWSHDVHDWLGGYPYESVAASDVRAFLHRHGLAIVREFVVPPSKGVFGTGCDEFVAIRTIA
ncbi:MAG TPA: class I SAM-dependent methyltransferase [Rhizomicrobium sp.]